MTFKRFILLSIAVHAVVLLLIYLMPPSRQEKQRELVATLVTPEAQAPPPARKKSLPVPRARIRPPARPAPHPGMRPAPPPVAVKPPPPPPEEKPTVPGEGPVLLGKIHPPRVIPKAGKYGGKSEKGAGRGMSIPPKPGLSGAGRSFDLFDKGVTEEIARRDTGGTKAEEGSKDSPITMDTKNYLYAPYLSLLRQKIESIWVYPPEAARRGIYGDLEIRFTIKKDGSLGDVELVRTSGYKMLDDAAIEALKDGAPYWPLPDSWGKKRYTILGRFIYSMYGWRGIQ